LRAFVDAGYDGDVDEDLFEAMAAAWIEGKRNKPEEACTPGSPSVESLMAKVEQGEELVKANGRH